MPMRGMSLTMQMPPMTNFQGMPSYLPMNPLYARRNGFPSSVPNTQYAPTPYGFPANHYNPYQAPPRQAYPQRFPTGLPIQGIAIGEPNPSAPGKAGI